MRETVIQKILDKKAIAIVRGYTPEEVLNLAQALYAGGVTLLELTFDQKSEAARQETAKILRLLNREMGERMCFGVGTVTTVEMVQLAKEAGARFVISPDMDPAVIQERGRQVAAEWARAMEDGKNGTVRDFVAVGDVEIRAIGGESPFWTVKCLCGRSWSSWWQKQACRLFCWA